MAKKARQARIPGTEPEHHKPLDDAATTYFEAMQERCRMSKEEDEAKDNLIDKMKEFGVERYESADGIVVTLTSTSNVKAKRKHKSEDEDQAAAGSVK